MHFVKVKEIDRKSNEHTVIVVPNVLYNQDKYTPLFIAIHIKNKATRFIYNIILLWLFSSIHIQTN